jgi:hypothetical protein
MRTWPACSSPSQACVFSKQNKPLLMARKDVQSRLTARRANSLQVVPSWLSHAALGFGAVHVIRNSRDERYKQSTRSAAGEEPGRAAR